MKTYIKPNFSVLSIKTEHIMLAGGSVGLNNVVGNGVQLAPRYREYYLENEDED